ncbi:amylo-alpha-1,6-glucosidase [Puniceicoccus vermicola]|uniref:Glycogen debranching protein n=1 Tax=Puniceicoccus vermicola TaxID=388746 RepID=A0A7X1E4G7_9BACT|nr:glycoside hydrolase 100 family protein [Puniceicoccus vermicola]MBC2602525.1 glycogen debranching protein [Puniceicoccus vermicola]
MNDQLLFDAEAAARKVIKKSFTPRGLCASSDGYSQVWARDTMITMLGASINGDDAVLNCLDVSIETLGAHQDNFGQIPYLVHCDSGQTEWGSSDANVWWILGVAIAHQHHDLSWRKKQAQRIVKALNWCEGMEIRKNDLMISTEMIDWADLMPNRDHVLFPNVLYSTALRVGAELLEDILPNDAARFREKSKQVRQAIRKLFLVAENVPTMDKTHFQLRTMIHAQLRHKPYFLPWVSQCDWGEHFDTTANLMTILTGIAETNETDRILDYIDAVGVNRPYPVRVLYPAIEPNDKEWRDYMKLFNLNLPNQYHNGGIWPWVGGLYVAALVKANRLDKAKTELIHLAEALRLGEEEWECNEWLHGCTGIPMGYPYQAWSAGVFLYALEAVKRGKLEDLLME